MNRNFITRFWIYKMCW